VASTPATFDRSIRPQDDFFRYVNGGWLKKTPIRVDDATGAGAFQELSERSRNGMHELFEAAAKTTPPAKGDQPTSVKVAANGPDQAERVKIGDLYRELYGLDAR
jgi:predicted metalloendopeptidase